MPCYFFCARGMGGLANRTSGKGRRLIISFAENALIRRLHNPLMNNQWTTYSWNVGMRKYTRKKLMVLLITKLKQYRSICSNLSVIVEIQSPPSTRSRGWVVPVVFLASPVAKEWIKSPLGRSVGKLEEAEMPLIKIKQETTHIQYLWKQGMKGLID